MSKVQFSLEQLQFYSVYRYSSKVAAQVKGCILPTSEQKWAFGSDMPICSMAARDLRVIVDSINEALSRWEINPNRAVIGVFSHHDDGQSGKKRGPQAVIGAWWPYLSAADFGASKRV
jgi:hypothetical protein